MEKLYDYVFWYNPYENVWYAIFRDTQLDFFRGNREKSIFYKSKEYSTLIELIVKDKITNGELKNI